MKKTALLIGLFLFIGPSFALADTPSCSAQGYTVVFVNGIFDTEPQARKDANTLGYQLGNNYNGEPLTVRLGYNQTHLAGLGDLAQSGAQLTGLFGGSISNFDLDTILMQVYPEVTTRKLMLVGHSQGAFYANSMYDYLLSHGEPIDAVGVYNVGSPAAYTAGHGKYLNSSNDQLLALLKTFKLHVLPSNIDIPPSGTGDLSGHGFVEDYLGLAGDRVTTDINSELTNLKPTDASNSGDCFTPPNSNLGYKTQAVAFAVADPTAVVLKAGAVATVQAGAVALNAASKLAVGAMQLFSDSIVITVAPPTQANTDANTFKIVNTLYGSSVDGLSAQDKKDLLGSSQGSAVLLATAQDKPLAVQGGFVEGTSTEVATTTPIVPAPVKNIFPDSTNGPVWVSGGSSQPTQVADVAPEVVDTTTSDLNYIPTPIDTATTTGDVASTTVPINDPVPPAPTLPTGAPFTDTFDSYNGSGWDVWYNSNNIFVRLGLDTGTDDPYSTDPTITNDCHSGSCLIANGGVGGIGSFGHSAIMYKETGVGQDQGAFTIWARARHGWRDSAANVGICVASSLGCIAPNLYWFGDIAPQDNLWHQYLFAWKQGPTVVEACMQRDDTNIHNCGWFDTNVSTGTRFDGIILNGNPIRPDGGDQVWFDDIEEAPAQ